MKAKSICKAIETAKPLIEFELSNEGWGDDEIKEFIENTIERAFRGDIEIDEEKRPPQRD